MAKAMVGTYPGRIVGKFFNPACEAWERDGKKHPAQPDRYVLQIALGDVEGELFVTDIKRTITTVLVSKADYDKIGDKQKDVLCKGRYEFEKYNLVSVSGMLVIDPKTLTA